MNRYEAGQNVSKGMKEARRLRILKKAEAQGRARDINRLAMQIYNFVNLNSFLNLNKKDISRALVKAKEIWEYPSSLYAENIKRKASL